MRREAVESTRVKSVGYKASRKILEIEFQSEEVYQYLDVPGIVYEGFCQARSKGQYFNSEIRDTYEFERLGRGRRATGR
jgi:hypothetical protein